MRGSFRVLWVLAGIVSLLVGVVGVMLPVLPTTPFVLVAAFCFSRGSSRFERWLLEHRVFGPIVQDWRNHHAVPRRAKQLAYAMMAISSIVSAIMLPLAWGWVPAACCAFTAVWVFRLPTRGTVKSNRRT